LKERYGPWGWLGQRAHDAEGINRCLPLDFIISCDYGVDTPYFMDEKKVFSIEKKEKVRKNWSNEHLNGSIKGDLGHEIYSRWGEYKRKTNLICYRSVRKLEEKKKLSSKNPRLDQSELPGDRRCYEKFIFFINIAKRRSFS